MIKEKLGFGIAFYRSALPEKRRVFRARSAPFGARGRIIRASTAFVKGSFFSSGLTGFLSRRVSADKSCGVAYKSFFVKDFLEDCFRLEPSGEPASANLYLSDNGLNYMY
jgi:hypothetical protein